MAQDSQNTDSLFDYFYVDKERISALTAQLFESGVLNNVKQTALESEKDLKEIKAGLPIIGGAFKYFRCMVSRTRKIL